MKKNTIIYVVAGVVALIIIALSIYLAVSNNSKSNNRYATKNIKIEKYNLPNYAFIFDINYNIKIFFEKILYE